MLKRLLSRLGIGRTASAAPVPLRVESLLPLRWDSAFDLPQPDWSPLFDLAPDGLADPGIADDWWTQVAQQWLQTLGSALGERYRLHAASDFLLLSALSDHRVQLCLDSCQRLLWRIRRGLTGVAGPRDSGKHVLIVFADSDDYYRYIGQFDRPGGTYAMSSGMFIPHGYGHFVLPEGDLDQMQPTIAHELTHCVLADLPIPAWLNEGMATNTEAALYPELSQPLYTPRELAAQHAAFWNAVTIQEYWSGHAFRRPDEGSRLAYDLAQRMTARAAQDEPAFRAFLREANLVDAGRGAEHCLGYPLEDLAIAMLGPGRWRPQPEQWRCGVLEGQF